MVKVKLLHATYFGAKDAVVEIDKATHELYKDLCEPVKGGKEAVEEAPEETPDTVNAVEEAPDKAYKSSKASRK